MVMGARPSSQSWTTFIRNHASGIAAMDLLVVPTIGFQLLYALVILKQDRRRILSVNVTGHPTAEWVARQMIDAFPWDAAPKYMIRDRDAIYGNAVIRRLRAMGIRDRPTAPRSPWQNGYVERLIGSIRRECLDHVIVFGEAHPRRILPTIWRITMRLVLIFLWARTLQSIARSSGSVGSYRLRYSVTSIIGTAGSSYC
jgi:transposase InsO family protein